MSVAIATPGFPRLGDGLSPWRADLTRCLTRIESIAERTLDAAVAAAD
jgi:hypothetical protein